MTLAELGPRICILGPSNSGKSTLADAIARATGLTPIHLDRLRHLPGSDWQLRPDAEFRALHDAALSGGRWVMDGDYLPHLPRRLARATGVVLLDVAAHVRLARYLRRCRSAGERIGGLGGRERVSRAMLHEIVADARSRREARDALFEAIALPKIRLAGSRALDRFHMAEGLRR